MRKISLLALLLFASAALADDWRLIIEGNHRYIYGDRALQGYVEIPWEVIIDFSVEQGQVLGAIGSARWLDKPNYGSVPANWFACELRNGSYLDANLRMLQMPRVRYSRFPLSGRVSDGLLELKPGYEAPGNYLAVTYGCQSDNPIAGNWFVFAQRARNEEGKRQDAETSTKGDHRQAQVSEVKLLPPAAAIQLPLDERWRFVQGARGEGDWAEYRLLRR